MSKRLLTTILSIAFLVVITLPTLLVIVDDNTDVSMVFSDFEEEENVSEQDIEALFSMTGLVETTITFSPIVDKISYFYKNYDTPLVSIISPPPELYIS